jgi:hypothetical protein
MATHIDQIQDAERERQAALKELVAEHGRGHLDQFRPGSAGCHELLDRSLLFARLVEEEVQNHPACLQNPRWYKLAERAVAALNDLYQRIGAEHLTMSEKP